MIFHFAYIIILKGGDFLREKNICKFIEESSVEKIETHCFIYETSLDVMIREYELKSHRMMLIRQGSGIIRIDET